MPISELYVANEYESYSHLLSDLQSIDDFLRKGEKWEKRPLA